MVVLTIAFFLASTFPVWAQAPAPSRRALLVAVKGYLHRGAKETPYIDLDTSADVQAIKNVLIQRFGFLDSEIIVLSTPEQTTHQKIMEAFRNTLIKDAKPGDTRYFHYSGHGSEAYDKHDILHRTLVPSDWKTRTQTAPEGNEILDSEITKLVSDLKAKLKTGQSGNTKSVLLLSFDCCHSGRLVADVRGGGAPKVRGRDPRFPLVHPASMPPPLPVPAPDATSDGVLSSDTASSKRGFVALMACRYNESAIETRPPVTTPAASSDKRTVTSRAMGLFSQCLAQSLTSATPGMTYRDLFERVRAEMAKRSDHPQNPVIEGDRDNFLLDGSVRQQKPYLPVVVRRPKNAAPQILLGAGLVQGVTVGSRFDLYPAGTTDFGKANPMWQAQVVHLDVAEATLQLIDPQNKPAALSAASAQKLEAARAVEKQHRYADPPVTIEFSPQIVKTQVMDALRQYLDALPAEQQVAVIADMGQASDYRVVRHDTAPQADPTAQTPQTNTPHDTEYDVVRLPSGLVVGTFSEAPVNFQTMRQQFLALMERLYRFRYMNALSVNESGTVKVNPDGRVNGICVEMRMVPVTVAPQNPALALSRNNVKFVSRLDAQGRQTTAISDPGTKKDWQQEEWFVIEVRNRGNLPAFISILDLPANGKIYSVYPDKGEERDLAAYDTSWHYITKANSPWPLVITSPFGKETLKLIATDRFADFTFLADDEDIDTVGRRGAADHPLGRLLRRVKEGKRAGSNNVETARMATATVPFTTVPKEP